MEELYTVDQWSLDKEHKRHNGALYAIWNAKPYLLSRYLIIQALSLPPYLIYTRASSTLLIYHVHLQSC